MNNLNLEDILIDRSSEDELMEIPLSGRVFKLFLVALFLILAVIVSQLFNLAFFQHDFYDRTASANFSKYEVERAPRGLIKDRFGEVIVSNEPSLKAFLSFNKMPKDDKEREGALLSISESLGLNHEDFLKSVENHDWSTGRFLIKNNINHDELLSVSSKNIPGLDMESSFRRVHSEPFVFSHIVGYTGLVTKQDINVDKDLFVEDDIGKSGLELYYDDYLRGENGRKVNIFNARGDIQGSSLVTESVRGKDLETFIDKDLQSYFYNRLEQQIDSLGTQAGAVGIVSSPKTGEILALVSVPSFENNNIAEYLFQEGQPFFNRALEGLYNPGSTIKPLVGVAALEEKVVDESDRIFSPGYLEIPNIYNPDNPSRFLDWKRHGWVDMYSALARSSNVYFYIVGGGYQDTRGLGISRLYQWWEKFNLDTKTGIDLFGEESGFIPNQEWKEKSRGTSWLVGDTYNVSIGQGDLILSPLGLISYINAIANRGQFLKFRISKVQEFKILKDITDEVSDSTFNIIEQGMIDAVEKDYGTANMLASVPMSIAGKTGSTEVGIDKKGRTLFL